jgi:hypothetical protein
MSMRPNAINGSTAKAVSDYVGTVFFQFEKNSPRRRYAATPASFFSGVAVRPE